MKRLTKRASKGKASSAAPRVARAVVPKKPSKAKRGGAKAKATPLSPAERERARLDRELNETREALAQRTAVLTDICESKPWLGVRVLGAVRRLATGAADPGARDRELNELAEIANKLLQPGALFSYDQRGWNLIRLAGALRRMVDRGPTKGGWNQERTELLAALRDLTRVK